MRPLLFAIALLPAFHGALVRAADYPHAAEPIAGVRAVYDGALTPDQAVNTFRNIDRLFPSRRVAHGDHVRPLPAAARPLTAVAFESNGRHWDLNDYLAVNRVAGLLVLKDGRVALELYQYGNTPRTRWMSMSVAKSITSTLIGAAIADGRIGSVDDPVVRYLPELAHSAYDGVSIRDVLTMSSGVRWDENYTNPGSDRRRLLDAQIAQQPGAAMSLMASLPRAAAPGTVNNYNTGETLVAGEVVHRATGKNLADYLAARIWQPYGMEADATWWLDSPDGIEIAGSGFAATLRDYARFGQYVLDGGRIDGRATLPDGWTAIAGARQRLKGGEPLDYGYFWWPAQPSAATPDPQGAFMAEGIFGQFIYINPAERVVIAAWSARSKPVGMDIINDADFFAAVSRALH